MDPPTTSSSAFLDGLAPEAADNESSTPFQAMEDNASVVSSNSVHTGTFSSPPSFQAMSPSADEDANAVELTSVNSLLSGANTTRESKYEPFNENDNDLKVYHGHADFDPDMQFTQISGSKWYFGKTKRAAVKVLYLVVFSMIGTLLRILLSQLFGEECQSPGSVGWLKAGQALCFTDNGETYMEGGIIFNDLPGNLLGSFFLGLMQSTTTMNDLPKAFPIAWLNEKNFFQKWDIIHIAIISGFCGSLTTFSSWNSEMVLLMMGADEDRGTSIFRGFFGYLIGVETALASFVFGKNLAKYLHSISNEALDREANVTTRKKECGVYINSQLSDYERRFLSELDMGEFSTYIDPVAEEHLHRWRNSTRENRRVGNHLLPLLTDVEYSCLVLDEDINDELLVSAMMAKWDMDALKKWREVKRSIPEARLEILEVHEFRFAPAFRVAFFFVALAVTGLVLVNEDDDYSVTYRTMIYAALLAPVGALTRERMSEWNGRWKRFPWLPLGTLTANVIACIASSALIAIEYRMHGSENFWKSGTIRAVKIGFAGSLSTVSGFINEFSDFLSSENPIRGYVYVISTIVFCAIPSALTYFLITFNEEPGAYYKNGKGYGY